MTDPDLRIRGGGGGGGGGSHPDPEIRRGGGGLENKFLWPLGPQFGRKIREALPWIHH